MAFVLNDRVKETTTTTGTGTVNLAGAETGFESFVAGIGNSNTTYYAIVHQSLDEFEVGLGTITDATPDTLARTTVISSSNSDSAVNFSAGTKDVFCTLPASKAIVEDGSGNLEIDISGIINLDADNGGNINLKDGGTLYGTLQKENDDLRIISTVQDGDIIFRGNDGGSYVNALTLDMSEAGAATFNNGVTATYNGTYQGTIATSAQFGTNGWINSTDGANRFYFTASSGATYLKINSQIYFQDASTGSNRLSVDGSGNLVVASNITAYGSPSDIKLKEDIEVIDNAVDKVKQLKGITYTLKSDGNRLTGLVAQDLEKVLPEAVYTAKDIETKDEHLAIRYGNTVGLLVEAIKELEARVKELEDK